jgi:putative intracellular protease/amidase
MKILMVLTSNSRLGTTGKLTGCWLEEFVAPYYLFRDSGAEVTLASPRGGQPPFDPLSDGPGQQTEIVQRFKADPDAEAMLASTQKLLDLSPDDYNGVFYPGGHGLLWDLVDFTASIKLIQKMLEVGKPVAAVCHAPAVLRHVRTAEGKSVIEGRNVTGFSNTEEETTGLKGLVPFLVEDMLKHGGGHYTKAADFEPHVVTDGSLITGQNPASSEPTAKAMLEKLSFFSAGTFVRSVPWRTV